MDYDCVKIAQVKGKRKEKETEVKSEEEQKRLRRFYQLMLFIAGGQDNSVTTIEKTPPLPRSISETHDGILSCDTMRTFWLSWDYTNSKSH